MTMGIGFDERFLDCGRSTGFDALVRLGIDFGLLNVFGLDFGNVARLGDFGLGLGPGLSSDSELGPFDLGGSFGLPNRGLDFGNFGRFGGRVRSGFSSDSGSFCSGLSFGFPNFGLDFGNFGRFGDFD